MVHAEGEKDQRADERIVDEDKSEIWEHQISEAYVLLYIVL